MRHPLQAPLRRLLVLLLVWTLGWITPARADLFTDARTATSVTLGQADTSGVSLRGGVNLRTFLPETSTTLFQTQATVGGSCGAFDLTTSLTQALETIPDLFANLIQALLGSMPMLVLCYTSPTLCDLAKHFQSLTNLLLQARFGQCQTLQTTMAATGLRLRSGQSARCLEDEQQQGTPLNLALERCLGEVSQLRNPFGLQASRVALVQETLEAAGVDPETVTLARQMLGEVTLTAGGSVFGTQQQRSPESLHRRYEQFQQTLVEQLREASATLAAGGTLSEALLQELSLPGQPLPRAALDALADLRADSVRHESLLQQLAAGLAITRLTWEVGELHTALAAAETVNAQLTDAERRLLEQRLAALQQELTRVRQEKETAERHLLPVVHALLAGHAAGGGRVAGRQGLNVLADRTGEVDVVSLARQIEPLPIEQALTTDPAVVVLGDPGSGKSTLLKVLALALAEQPDGPLPILLPLNAYARCLLNQGELNLSQFLGDFYAGRQQKLKRVGALFHQALAANQAVILLDGLDEVQANRTHLVRLVQDFVAEYVPEPAEELESTEAVVGNRVVVTSRIVGYDEAPLASRQWRTYTLIDFTRVDIEQFVTQWTLALARSIQGDTEPARQAAAQERHDLLEAIFSRPSVERLAANPLLLTILSLIKHTGVVLPEQRVKLYELYLQTLIESWNLARSLDQYPVGEGMPYEETVQVLAPLALWLRQENPTAGLVTQEQLEHWLTEYYHGEEWALPRGEARQRGRAFLDSVQRYSNLLLERGDRQYGFLHLTLEEMLAAQGLVQLLDEKHEDALALFRRYLLDPTWHETLQLAIGFIGVIQRRPKSAGAVLQALLNLDIADDETDRGRPVIVAGEALLDMGIANVSRSAALEVEQALVQTMQSATCPIRTRRDAGNLLGRLHWTPDLQKDDLILASAGAEPTGLDAFRPVSGMGVWMGKYPVTNRQFARFLDADGYHRQEFWGEAGWAWRTGSYDSKAPEELQNWLKSRPPDKRDRPLWWDDRTWNSPLFPVVGITWFEAEAYARWLTEETRRAGADTGGNEILDGLLTGRLMVRLPTEAEWETAMGGGGDYSWGKRFESSRLNCAESWVGEEVLDDAKLFEWIMSDTESRREAGTTAVTTYPQGVSQAGVWDGSGNVWEWMGNPYEPDGDDMALRGGAWNDRHLNARVSSRNLLHPDIFIVNIGFRVVLAPVVPVSGC